MKIGFIGGGRVVSWQLDRITKNPNLEFCGIYDIDSNVRKHYKDDGFKVLMINTDTPRSIGKVKSYGRAQDYKFHIGMDPNKVISKKLNGMVMPTMILVDKGGEVKWRHQGYIAGEEIQAKNQITQLLERNLEEKIEG